MTDERKRRGRPRLDLDDAAICTAFDSGMSIRAIAQQFSISRGAVRRRLPPGESSRQSIITDNRPQRAGHKATGPLPKASIACENSACDRTTKKPPYCYRCRRRVQRHGDPAIVLPRGRKKAS